MQLFLEAVRKATLPGVWSLGVKLAREGSVVRGADASTFRVRAPGHAVAPTVTLFVEDAEWSCDCGGKVDPCAHVAAATIAAAQGMTATPAAAEAGKGTKDANGSAAEVAAPPRIVYRLAKKDRTLSIVRVLVHPDGHETKVGSLSNDIARGRLQEFAPTHEDVRIDRILGNPPREVIPLGRVGDVLEALSHDAEVTFEGARVSVVAEPILPRAIVEDAPGGVVLRMEKDPRITQVIAMGVARCGDTIHPLGETETTGEFLERLPLSRIFAKHEETELVTKVLPELEKKIPVTVTAKRLPRKATAALPRISMDLSHKGHTLSVLPTLVYGDPPIARVDGDVVTTLGRDVPVRKREVERELLRRLRDELNLVPGRRVDLDGAEAIRFAGKLRDWQTRSGDHDHAAVFDARPLRARLDTAGDKFDVVFELDDGAGDESNAPTRRADAVAVIRAWHDGLDLVPLEGGGWAPLPADWLAKHGHKVADLLAARDADKKLARASLPELASLCEELDAPRPLIVDKLAPLLAGFEGIPRAPLPAGINATLRAYQEVGVDWLTFLRGAELGAVLADDMGLGKTLQTICALQGRALVVCPKSVVYNWVDEIARFRPGLRAAIYHGNKRELDHTADVTLTTYAVLRLDVDVLAEEPWDVVVLDEAQAIKNEGSQTARAAFELHGKFKVALSGTPVENRLEELWSVMHFANPGLLGGRSDFQERYVSAIAAGDPTAASRLRAKIRPFVLRRMKKDVLPELPPRTDQVLYVELDERERAVYDAVRVATQKDVADKLAKGGGVLAALEALLRLRQAACHTKLVPGQEGESSSKVERLLEALEELVDEGHKALVFSQWTSLLNLVEPHLQNAGIAFTRLDGSTKDRGAVVTDFQRDAGPPVMLVSLKAGGTGLNLTAADHVFLLDPWWNPAVEDQAADRAHRIGQDKPVMVYRMVAKDTVEERISHLQVKKRALADVALGDANHAGGITKDELLGLLA